MDELQEIVLTLFWDVKQVGCCAWVGLEKMKKKVDGEMKTSDVTFAQLILGENFQ